MVFFKKCPFKNTNTKKEYYVGFIGGELVTKEKEIITGYECYHPDMDEDDCDKYICPVIEKIYDNSPKWGGEPSS